MDGALPAAVATASLMVCLRYAMLARIDDRLAVLLR